MISSNIQAILTAENLISILLQIDAKGERLTRILKEYYKYCVVGVIITALDFCMLAFQVEICKVYYLLAACISYLIASGLHYILSAKYVFTKSETQKTIKAFVIFALLGAIGLGLFESLMFYFVDTLKIYYLVAKIFATGIIFSFNFATRKLFLFK